MGVQQEYSFVLPRLILSFLSKGGTDSTDTGAEIELDIACGTGAKGTCLGERHLTVIHV